MSSLAPPRDSLMILLAAVSRFMFLLRKYSSSRSFFSFSCSAYLKKKYSLLWIFTQQDKGKERRGGRVKIFTLSEAFILVCLFSDGLLPSSCCCLYCFVLFLFLFCLSVWFFFSFCLVVFFFTFWTPPQEFIAA